MAIHNRTNPHVGVSHPDNYGAYVTDDATGKITWRNTGQGGGREGGHANVHGGAASSGYKEFRGTFPTRNQGSLIATNKGVTTAYALFGLEPRGVLFIGPNTDVYEGMVVGAHNRPVDLDLNPCKMK